MGNDSLVPSLKKSVTVLEEKLEIKDILEKAIIEEERSIGELVKGRSGAIDVVYAALKTGEGAMSPRLIARVKEHTGPEINIFDSAPGTSCSAVETLKGADLCVLVCDPTPFGIHDLKLAVEMCRGLEQEPVVLVNRAERISSTLWDYCEEAELEIIEQAAAEAEADADALLISDAWNALINDPNIIIVDEPTAGLDPEERNRFLNLLSDIGENKVVILSTHIVDDVTNLCPRMAIIAGGEIVVELVDPVIAGERGAAVVVGQAGAMAEADHRRHHPAAARRPRGPVRCLRARYRRHPHDEHERQRKTGSPCPLRRRLVIPL